MIPYSLIILIDLQKLIFKHISLHVNTKNKLIIIMIRKQKKPNKQTKKTQPTNKTTKKTPQKLK
jgi:hypothetical protein